MRCCTGDGAPPQRPQIRASPTAGLFAQVWRREHLCCSYRRHWAGAQSAGFGYCPQLAQQAAWTLEVCNVGPSALEGNRLAE
jgi:hypothetical protein